MWNFSLPVFIDSTCWSVSRHIIFPPFSSFPQTLDLAIGQLGRGCPKGERNERKSLPLATSQTPFPFPLIGPNKYSTTPYFTSPLTQRRSVRIAIHAFFNLIRPSSSIGGWDFLPLTIQTVPFIIRGGKFQLADNQRQDCSEFRHHQVLGDAVPRPMFEKTPCAFHGVKLFAGLRELAFGKECVRVFPIFRCAMQFHANNPDNGVVRRTLIALGIDNVDSWFSCTTAPGRCKQS